MSNPQSRKLSDDEANIAIIRQRTESKLKKFGWVKDEGTHYRTYRIEITRGRLLSVLEEAIVESYNAGKAYNDATINIP